MTDHLHPCTAATYFKHSKITNTPRIYLQQRNTCITILVALPCLQKLEQKMLKQQMIILVRQQHPENLTEIKTGLMIIIKTQCAQ